MPEEMEEFTPFAAHVSAGQSGESFPAAAGGAQLAVVFSVRWVSLRSSYSRPSSPGPVYLYDLPFCFVTDLFCHGFALSRFCFGTDLATTCQVIAIYGPVLDPVLGLTTAAPHDATVRTKSHTFPTI